MTHLKMPKEGYKYSEQDLLCKPSEYNDYAVAFLLRANSKTEPKRFRRFTRGVYKVFRSV